MTVTTWTPSPASALRQTASVAGEGLALAGLHLGDRCPPCSTIPPISCTSKCRMAHRALADLADDRERLRQQVVEGLAVRARSRRAPTLAQLVVPEVSIRLDLVDARDALLVGLGLRPSPTFSARARMSRAGGLRAAVFSQPVGRAENTLTWGGLQPATGLASARRLLADGASTWRRCPRPVRDEVDQFGVAHLARAG